MSQNSFTGEDIIWEAETNFEYILENKELLNFETVNSNNGLPYAKSFIETIKIDVTARNVFSHTYFTETLINFVGNGVLKAYSLDKNIELSTEDIQRLTSFSDTVVVYHPETYEKRTIVVNNDYSDEVHSFLIKQRWKYDSKTHRLTSKVLGIIPILYFGSQKIKLFWIPFNNNDHSEKLSFNDPDKIWIKYSIDRVSFERAIDKKGNANDFFEELWRKSVENGHKIYDIANRIFFADELASNYIKENLLQPQTDTIITFDPETYAETHEIVINEGISFENISGYKLHQFWYFDKSKMTLNSELIAIAPLVSRKTSNEKEEYYQTLFNIKFK